MRDLNLTTLLCLILSAGFCQVYSFAATAGEPQRVREAATRSVRLIETTSAKFLEKRECFTCHTQALSVMVLKEARRRGFDINKTNLRQQVERAFEIHPFTKQRQPGSLRVDTVGYALWALQIGGHVPDHKTEDMTWYLLKYQRDLGHWKTVVDRPPTEASDFSTNYVAIRALNRYGNRRTAKGD